jgi:preprotein translocase subunit SecD
MEDEVISQPRVSSMIDSDSCVITGDFTAETAKALADQINVGVMPFTFEPSTYTY